MDLQGYHKITNFCMIDILVKEEEGRDKIVPEVIMAIISPDLAK